MSQQYSALGQKIIETGVWVYNNRTGKRCKTVINHDMKYPAHTFPIVTTRKSYWKSAVAELLGYIRGYSSAADFRQLGTKTWDANANMNEAWLKNPARKGEDDMGMVYGAVARHLPSVDSYGKPYTQDTFRQIYDKICKREDDRGLILNFWNQGVFDIGCLRPCMYSHHFSILDRTLHLNSTQRSCDVPLGLNFNMVQVYVLLAIMAQITDLKQGTAYHKIVNAHVYEDQYELFYGEMKRTPTAAMPQFHINPAITSLEDLETWVTLDDFWVTGYSEEGTHFLEPIKYPFSV